MLIGNDSASVHVASAVNTPSIAFVGGGHYDHFLPYPSTLPDIYNPSVVEFKMDCYGCNWKCPFQVSSELPVPCINSITLESAMRAFDHLHSFLP